MSRFRVRFTPDAEEDLLRLFDFLLEQDYSSAERAAAAIAKAVELLEVFPFSCRKAMIDVMPSAVRLSPGCHRKNSARSGLFLFLRHIGMMSDASQKRSLEIAIQCDSPDTYLNVARGGLKSFLTIARPK